MGNPITQKTMLFSSDSLEEILSVLEQEPMPHQILSGHTSFDTAYINNDYPYGRTLRCKRKCWIETATKGAKKEQMRFVTCTTNPKLSREHWNNPHAGQYNDFLIMYLDAETGYIQTAGVDISSLSRVEVFKTDWYELLTTEQRSYFDKVELRARQLNSANWRITASSYPS